MKNYIQSITIYYTHILMKYTVYFYKIGGIKLQKIKIGLFFLLCLN